MWKSIIKKDGDKKMRTDEMKHGGIFLLPIHEKEEKKYCPKCKQDTMMMAHTSHSRPMTFTCMECGETYAWVDGELLVIFEGYEYD